MMRPRRILFILAVLLCSVLLHAQAAETLTPDGWRYEVVSGVARIKAYIGSETEVTVPAAIDGYPTKIDKLQATFDLLIIPEGVQSIAAQAFMQGNAVEVRIESAKTKIAEEAFNSCQTLQSVTLPEGLTALPESCFNACSSLQLVDLPQSLTTLGSNCFSGCTSLAYTLLPSQLTTIEASAFSECTALEAVDLPATVTKIGGNAFRGCSKLEHLTIPDKVTTIGSSAFCNCSALQSIQLPPALTGSLKFSTFEGCASLTSIDLPDGIDTLGNLVFKDCTSLTSVHLPASLKTVPDDLDANDPFKNCPVLTTFTAKEGSWAYKWAIDRGWRYQQPRDPNPIVIPASVVEISEEAFTETGCREVIISEGIRRIRSKAFAQCSQLVYVTLPESLVSIADDAFGTAEAITFLLGPGSRHIAWAEQRGYHYEIVDAQTGE